MNFHVISIFPDMFRAICHYGVTAKAFDQKLVDLTLWNPRDFTMDKHQQVDDRPFGGGPGMLMKVEPLQKAIQAAKKQLVCPASVIYLSPQGRPVTQEIVGTLAKAKHLILVSGRYEGIDERLIESEIDEEYSIGDYVLTGGELPAMVLMDAIIRQIPGALGDAESSVNDSFMHGLLDYPQYTRPRTIAGKSVPEVLLNGNHQEIDAWRMQQMLKKTWLKRPDLLKNLTLTEKQQELLAEFESKYVNTKGDRDE